MSRISMYRNMEYKIKVNHNTSVNKIDPKFPRIWGKHESIGVINNPESGKIGVTFCSLGRQSFTIQYCGKNVWN